MVKHLKAQSETLRPAADIGNITGDKHLRSLKKKKDFSKMREECIPLDSRALKNKTNQTKQTTSNHKNKQTKTKPIKQQNQQQNQQQNKTKSTQQSTLALSLPC